MWTKLQGNVFFTADNHFDHKNIIGYLDRPFRCVEEMNETMVERWNSRVKPSDVVVHAGDFAWGGAAGAAKFASRLNGRILLARGNHDPDRLPDCFERVSQILELQVGPARIVVCHYAMLTWNESCNGAWHLFGHTHGRMAPPAGRPMLDIGVDCHGFAPLHFDEVRDRIERVCPEWADIEPGPGIF